MKKLSANVLAGILVLLYAIVMFLESRSLAYYTKSGPGPGFFPMWVSSVLIILAAVYIWIHLKKSGITLQEILPVGKALKNNLSVGAAIIVFMLLLNTTGYVIACTAMMSIVLLGQYKWHIALSISASTAILLLLLFQYVMEIPLPTNALGF